MKTMKILITHGQFAEFGGAEGSILALMKGLNKRGHRTSLLTEFPIGTNSEIPRARKESLKIPIRLLKMLKKAKEAIKKTDAIIVSIHGPLASLPTIWAALTAAKLYRKRTVAYIYEPTIWLGEFDPFWLRLLSAPLIAVDSILFRLFKPSVVIAISSLTKQFIENRYHTDVVGIVWPCF